jgi:hypothetical protein
MGKAVGFAIFQVQIPALVSREHYTKAGPINPRFQNPSRDIMILPQVLKSKNGQRPGL